MNVFLAELLQDLRWLEAKNERGLTFDLVADYAAALVLSVDHPRQRILRLLEEALRRDIHFIARHTQDYPQGLFQCLWNNGWWYDCPDAAQHYVEGRPPALASPACGGSVLGEGEHAAHEATAEPRLHHILERWRNEKDQTSPGFPWLRSLRPPPMQLGTAQFVVLGVHEKRVNCVAFSPDGDRIASGSEDKTVRVWDAHSGAELTVLRGHMKRVSSISYSPDGRRIATGSWDMTVRVWDAESGAELAVLRGHKDSVNCVLFSPDGRQIASGGGHLANHLSENTLRVWDPTMRRGGGTKRPARPVCGGACAVENWP